MLIDRYQSLFQNFRGHVKKNNPLAHVKECLKILFSTVIKMEITELSWCEPQISQKFYNFLSFTLEICKVFVEIFGTHLDNCVASVLIVGGRNIEVLFYALKRKVLFFIRWQVFIARWAHSWNWTVIVIYWMAIITLIFHFTRDLVFMS